MRRSVDNWNEDGRKSVAKHEPKRQQSMGSAATSVNHPRGHGIWRRSFEKIGSRGAECGCLGVSRSIREEGRKTRLVLRGAILLATVSCFLGIPVAAPGAIVSAVQYSSGELQAQQQSGAKPKEDEITTTLIERVGEPAQGDIETFKKAGMQDVTPHILTAEERIAVEAALASLPTLNKHVLEQHLHKLAFVDGIPGEGTGLTSPSAKTGLSDITLRASVINESLTTFLTNKERRVYKQDGSRLTISVTGTDTNALSYVLSHESTHVVDVSCRITTNPHSRFVQGIWTGHSTLAPSFAAITPKTYFRGADHLPIVKASDVYDAKVSG